MGKAVLAVQAAAKEGRDAEFNDWYTNVHLREILAIPGFTEARRYRVSRTQLGEWELPRARYLTLYSIDSADIAPPIQAVSDALPTMSLSDSVDASLATAVVYEEIAHRTSAQVAAAG